MADFQDRAARGRTGTAGLIDTGLRNYLLRVYNYMIIAMLVTGVTAYAVYSACVTSDPAQAAATLKGGLMLTQFGLTLFGSPLRYVAMFAPIVAVLVLQVRLNSISVGAAQLGFWAFSALLGVSMSSIFMIYAGSSIAMVFFITAAAFGGLSLYGYTTSRDLSGMGSFLIMGVWGIFIALIVNLFLNSPMIMWVASVAGVGIFAGLTAYDTQTIKNMYSAQDDGTVTGRNAIRGALYLYLDFINMFQFLLYLIGNRR